MFRWTSFHLVFGIAMAWLVFTWPMAAHASIGFSLDPLNPALDDSIRLQVTIETGDSIQPPTLPSLPGVRFDFASSGVSTIITNGSMSVKRTFVYRVIAKEPGSYTIPSFTVQSGKKKLISAPFTFRVSKAAQRADGAAPSAFAEATSSHSAVYVGEQLIYRAKLMSQQQARELQVDFPQNLRALVEPMGQTRVQIEEIDKAMYRIYTVQAALYPLDAGSITIPSTLFQYQVLRRAERADPFDRLFGGSLFNRGNRRDMEIETEPLTIVVKPLPITGRPTDFSGIVGKVTIALENREGRFNLKQGESISLRLVVTTTGAMPKDLKLGWDAVPTSRRAKLYPSRSTIEKDQQLGDELRLVQQRYHQDVALVPLEAGELEVGALTLSYFDPEDGTYKEVSTATHHFNIEASGNAMAGTESTNESTVAVAPSSQQLPGLTPDPTLVADDLLPHVPFTEQSLSRSQAFRVNPAIVALALSIPIVLLLLHWQRNRSGERRELRLRERQQRKQIKEILRELSKNAGSLDHDRRYALYISFLRNMVSLPAGVIVASELQLVLERSRFSNQLIEALVNMLNQLESLRHGQADVMNADNQLRLDRALEKLLRNAFKKRPPPSLSQSQLFVVLGPLVAAALLGSVTPLVAQESGTWSTVMRAQTYFAAHQFGEAAACYEQAIEQLSQQSVANGYLYYNLGNTYFRANRFAQAMLNYHRATLLLPYDSDLRSNRRRTAEQLRLARDTLPRSLEQTLFFWGRWLSWKQQWLLAIALYLATLLLLIQQLRGRSNSNLPLAIVSIFFVLIASGIVATSISWRQPLLMVTKPDSALRSGNGESFTQTTRLQAGTVLIQLAEQEGWHKVKSFGGKKGWLSVDAAQPLQRLSVVKGSPITLSGQPGGCRAPQESIAPSLEPESGSGTIER